MAKTINKSLVGTLKKKFYSLMNEKQFDAHKIEGTEQLLELPNDYQVGDEVYISTPSVDGTEEAASGTYVLADDHTKIVVGEDHKITEIEHESDEDKKDEEFEEDNEKEVEASEDEKEVEASEDNEEDKEMSDEDEKKNEYNAELEARVSAIEAIINEKVLALFEEQKDKIEDLEEKYSKVKSEPVEPSKVFNKSEKLSVEDQLRNFYKNR